MKTLFLSLPSERNHVKIKLVYGIVMLHLRDNVFLIVYSAKLPKQMPSKTHQFNILKASKIKKVLCVFVRGANCSLVQNHRTITFLSMCV